MKKVQNKTTAFTFTLLFSLSPARTAAAIRVAAANTGGSVPPLNLSGERFKGQSTLQQLSWTSTATADTSEPASPRTMTQGSSSKGHVGFYSKHITARVDHKVSGISAQQPSSCRSTESAQAFTRSVTAPEALQVTDYGDSDSDESSQFGLWMAPKYVKRGGAVAAPSKAVPSRFPAASSSGSQNKLFAPTSGMSMSRATHSIASSGNINERRGRSLVADSPRSKTLPARNNKGKTYEVTGAGGASSSSAMSTG
ncbi:unnamed protein product, partial [Amoebophrya sp. A25]|eukprot:GSA25T00017237001.1